MADAAGRPCATVLEMSPGQRQHYRQAGTTSVLLPSPTTPFLSLNRFATSVHALPNCSCKFIEGAADLNYRFLSPSLHLQPSCRRPSYRMKQVLFALFGLVI